MSMMLLTTKLYLPSLRAGAQVVARPRLRARLDEARPLVLISAAAGSGKSTLLSDWINHSQRRVAWLSLDEGDNDPARFWAYFIAALQTVHAGLGGRAQAVLQAAGQEPLPLESFLTVLLNELAATPERLVLVLDDYHVILTPTIHEGLTFLLDHLPPQAQVILTSRADPPLPLARMRAKNEITEIRADDLRFTPDETAVLFNEMMGLDLPAEDIAVLEARTEGWAVGLKLAVLSLTGRDETSRRSFVSTFAGSQRYILDYLVEEVLQRQPAATQAFLLQTSILARLSGSLCDALTGRTDGQATLEALERANLFLIPLDDERRWYRYHHLFAEVLRVRLQQNDTTGLPLLHQRAAAWCEARGLTDEALRHALAAGDAERAARLVEQHVEEMLSRGQGETVRRWLAALPPAAVRARPRLSLAKAIAAFNSGRLQEAQARFEDAERAIENAASEPFEPTIGRESSMLANVPASLALLRASAIIMRGETGRAVDLIRLAESLLSPDETGPRYSVRWNMALVEWMRGHMVAAERAFTDIVADGRAEAKPHLILSASSVLGHVQQAQGRLEAALHTYRQGLEFAAPGAPAVLPSVAIAYVDIAGVLYQRNQFDAALRYVTQAIPLARQLTSVQFLGSALTTLAWIRQARGDAAGAQEAMEEAYRASTNRDAAALYNAVPSERARLMLAQGRVTEALGWVAARGLADDDEIGYAREREHLLLARLRLAQNSPERALGLLAHLGAAAEAQARTGSVIEVRVLEALALRAHGQPSRATDALEQALALALPEGYVRVFIDEGAPMAGLLRQVTGEQRPHAERLLAAWELSAPEAMQTMDHAQPLAAGARPDPLIEPLTERELDVLRLLSGGLSNPEIAQKLYLSAGTVKVHLKHIYSKLNANRRTQAVARARELGLL